MTDPVFVDTTVPIHRRDAGCPYVPTEAMARGAVFEGLILINPFRASPDEVLRRN
ncbi:MULTISPECIES: hypothetical protein [Methylobacterium]|jgi:predicted nucleic acid-binding protein|uniref:Uncharacterized protein n=1 Tax=Methylobacterium longum TaxID=767694 RepID=A0ABT8AUI9_9HYPH|nr:MULTISPECIES: hypothetical protein [Methylobacterium]MCJ2102250.1 hypothetical protein [Methylobacterium sp. E-046]MDN3573623.1 hypothetical protein [Methylobacterium longum]GJE15024.1 hypothetical protein FOHLNKBM_6101 [Methylobacterium longum]